MKASCLELDIVHIWTSIKGNLKSWSFGESVDCRFGRHHHPGSKARILRRYASDPLHRLRFVSQVFWLISNIAPTAPGAAAGQVAVSHGLIDPTHSRSVRTKNFFDLSLRFGAIKTRRFLCVTPKRMPTVKTAQNRI
jgi:hypothetical protein